MNLIAPRIAPDRRLAAEGEAALSSVGWLADMPAAFRAAMFTVTRWKLVDPGETVYASGEEDAGMFAIARGVAEVALDWGHPDAPIIHVVHAGFWAGYRPLLGRSTMLHLVAREEVLCALIPRRRMLALLAEEPSAWACLADLIDRNATTVSRMFADLTLRDARQRAVATLLRLGGVRFSGPPAGIVADVCLGQGEIAGAAVMSRNTLGAILGALAEEGLVELCYRRVRILRPHDLRAMVDQA